MASTNSITVTYMRAFFFNLYIGAMATTAVGTSVMKETTTVIATPEAETASRFPPPHS